MPREATGRLQPREANPAHQVFHTKGGRTIVPVDLEEILERKKSNYIKSGNKEAYRKILHEELTLSDPRLKSKDRVRRQQAAAYISKAPAN